MFVVGSYSHLNIMVRLHYGITDSQFYMKVEIKAQSNNNSLEVEQSTSSKDVISSSSSSKDITAKITTEVVASKVVIKDW